MTHPTPLLRESRPRPTDLLNAALRAAERGWPVFPLQPGGKRPALHGEARCPGTGVCSSGHVKWQDRATTDPDRIRRAWSAGAFNVGIATGPAGLLVVDLDVPKSSDADAPDGAANFRALCERHGRPVPTTRTVRTASGGTHLYFVAPAAARLHNTAGTLAPLVDTRAWGGYVVASGSSVGGRTYGTVGPAVLKPLPGWLLELLVPPHPAVRERTAGGASGPFVRNPRRYVAVAVDQELHKVRTTPEGGRNTTLYRAALSLGRFVCSGDLARQDLEAALQEAGEASGLPSADCRATIRSGLDWSLAHNPRREVAA